MGTAYQLGGRLRMTKGGAARARRYYKRQAARLRRRAEALDPENAPARCWHGWAD